jgi:CRISPR-associated DxTHG motif protein
MKIGLSFLGIGEYGMANYYWAPAERGAQEYNTTLFPETLPAFFNISKLLVFVTQKAAANKNCLELQRRMGSLLKLVEIPEGKNKTELWEIFSIVAAEVPPQSEIIIDVTHAFRSLPLIVFNVASYLRRVKNVKVEQIVYGNWEARDPSHDPPRTPVIDLTTMLELQDWLHGIDAFRHRGEADELAESLSRTQGQIRQITPSDVENANLPRELKYAATQLSNFSEALRLLRPLDVFEASAKLNNLLKTVQEEAQRWAKPFANVLQDLNKEINPLLVEKPTVLNLEHLKTQVKLIRYYLKKDLVVQAVLLAREWLVSFLIWRLEGQVQWRERNKRLSIEKELNCAAASQRGEKTTLPAWYNNLPESKELTSIWNKIIGLRNDVAHCAMNIQTRSASTIRSSIQKIIARLENLIQDP